DVARWYDVCAGYDSRDPYSLPSHGRWEAELGSHGDALHGLRVALVPAISGATIRPELEEAVRLAAVELAEATGMVLVDGVEVSMPGLGYEWALANLAGLAGELGDLWPDCKEDLTKEIAFGIEMAKGVYDLDMAGRVEQRRTEANEAMAAVFD